MPYTPEHKEETRERIVRSARRLFNRRGFAEVTIDEIMADAGLTRGGFYHHFNTKEELYAAAILKFICLEAPEPWQRKHVHGPVCGPELARMIVNAYLSRDHFEDLDGSCPMAALPSDVARSSDAVKSAFRQVFDRFIRVFTASLPEPEARQRALALVAMCVGGMAVARAVDEAGFADEVLEAARQFVLAATGWEDGEAVSS
jgi:TetR/AcrR family transcriptional regulator, transcriptional repressor for nem operon